MGSILLLSGAVQAQKIEKADTSWVKTKWLDLAYANQSPTQKLDIYLPEIGKGPFPIILSIHGGAFKFGDKADDQLTPMLKGLKRGYAVISINYRLSGEATWPAAIHDVKAAIRWVKAKAEKFNLNPKKIAVWGGSAGGYLAALVGTSSGVTELEDLSMGNPDQTTNVHAVIDWFGPIDFLSMDKQFMDSGIAGQQHSTPDSFESQMIGKPITEVPELIKAANPETYISHDDPPFWIQHGTNDAIIPIQQSENFAKKLREVIGPSKVTFKPIPGAKHGGVEFNDSKNLDEIFSFLNTYLKN
nr:alpha/beta hydrolase [Spartinivicinus marinus]